MDQTVNLTSSTSVVRIHLFPPGKAIPDRVSLFLRDRGDMKKRRIRGGSREPRAERGAKKQPYNLSARRCFAESFPPAGNRKIHLFPTGCRFSCVIGVT